MAKKKLTKDNVTLLLENMKSTNGSSSWENQDRAVYTVQSMKEEISKLLPTQTTAPETKKSSK